MTSAALYRQTEMDRTTWPEFRDQVQAFVAAEAVSRPRSYPGYPNWPLERCRPRLWPALEPTLWSRRSAMKLTADLPPRRQLSRLLQFSHGVSGGFHRGPTPSAGGLQALELFLVNFTDGWLPPGLYHYGRSEHCLAQIVAGAERDAWGAMAPSLNLLAGGALLWVVVGDSARVAEKYGERGLRFLILEAGHLMQNLCLMSQRLGYSTVPLGGFFERDIAHAFLLPPDDVVLNAGACGRAV